MIKRDHVALEGSVGPMERAYREQELQEMVEESQRLLEAYKASITRRDDLIRILYRKTSTTRALIRITGLSRDRLYTIAGRPMSTD